MRRVAPHAVLSLALPAIALLAGCVTPHYVVEQQGSQSVAVTGSPRVVVQTFNGGVEVVAGAADVVGVSWTKKGSSPESRAAAEKDLANVEVTVLAGEGEVRVVAHRTDGRAAGSSGASFRLTAPRGCPLSVTTDNGRVSVAGLGAPVVARSSNGRVTVTDAQGALDLSTSNGSVDVSGTGVVLAVRSSNGSLSFVGDLAKGDHALTTLNGSIDVRLPADAKFALDARTTNGAATCEFPLAGEGARARTALAGTVGERPEATLRLRTSNGSIGVRRAS